MVTVGLIRKKPPRLALSSLGADVSPTTPILHLIRPTTNTIPSASLLPSFPPSLLLLRLLRLSLRQFGWFDSLGRPMQRPELFRQRYKMLSSRFLTPSSFSLRFSDSNNTIKKKKIFFYTLIHTCMHACKFRRVVEIFDTIKIRFGILFLRFFDFISNRNKYIFKYICMYVCIYQRYRCSMSDSLWDKDSFWDSQRTANANNQQVLPSGLLTVDCENSWRPLTNLFLTCLLLESFNTIFSILQDWWRPLETAARWAW